jgi:hypothetical protein
MEELRAGTVRPTMKANPLLVKPELGQVKKIQFNAPPPDHVFGYNAPPDPEGVRELTMKWKEHSPSVGGTDTTADGNPVLDFTTMNKLSAMTGLTTAAQQRAFRSTHPVTVKKGASATQPTPGLPSDKDPSFTYGMPASHRTSEVKRWKG